MTIYLVYTGDYDGHVVATFSTEAAAQELADAIDGEVEPMPVDAVHGKLAAALDLHRQGLKYWYVTLDEKTGKALRVVRDRFCELYGDLTTGASMDGLGRCNGHCWAKDEESAVKMVREEMTRQLVREAKK